MDLDRIRSSAAAFSGLIVRREDLELLRLCLYEGASWRAAWDQWVRRVGDPKAAFAYRDEGLKGLLPLLAVAAQRSGHAIDPAFQTYLRTAYLREQARFESYSRACRGVLAALAEASLQPIVLSGSALAEAVYPEAATRHSHGLRLLWRQRDDLLRAATLLEQKGLTTGEESGLRDAPTRTLTHRSLMPIFLQDRLLPDSPDIVPVEDVWARSRPQLVAGMEALTLSHADALLEICGQAALLSERGTLRWACDAWLLVERSPDLDWKTLTAAAIEARLQFPVAALLQALHDTLDAKVPGETLAFLFDAARKDPLAMELTFRTFRLAEGLTHLGLVRRAHVWRDRVVLSRDLLFPSAEYMAWFFGKPPVDITWRLYLKRLWDYATAAIHVW